MRSYIVRGSAAILLLALAGVVFLRRPAPEPPTSTSRVPAAAAEARLARLPSILLPNGGELPSEVRYVLRDRNVSARFRDDGITWTVAGPGGGVMLTRRFLEGRARPAADGESGAVVSRFTGERSTWTSGLRVARALVYAELWPGVEFRVEPRAAAVEYSFTVAAGADLDRVRFAYEGMPAPTVDSGGDLRVETPAGPLRESTPRAFQEVDGVRRELACRFDVLPDGSFGFSVPGRDPGRPLLVDPVLDYSSWLGSGNGGGVGSHDGLFDVKLDSAGNVIVAGVSISDFPVTAGAYDTARSSDDYFVAKLNPAGTALLWATFLGGSSGEPEPRVALDASDNIVVAGSASADFPVTPGAYRSIGQAGVVYAVCKLSADGSSLLWSTFVGEGQPKCVALDSSGNVIVGGNTSFAGYPTTPGAYDTTHGGFRDAFVTRVAADGSSLLWSTLLGEAGDDEARGLAVDASGAVTVGGYTTSAAFPTTPGAYDTGPGTLGNKNGFVTRIAPGGGSLVWSTYLRGSGDDFVQALALDGSSNVFVHVYAFSNDFPTTPGSYKPTRGPTDDMVLAKIQADGSTLEWSTFIGSISETSRSSLIAVDAAGNVYATGRADFSAFPTTPGAWDVSWAGGGEAFALRLNAGGATLQWSTFIGGQQDEWGGALALDPSGNLVVAVETISPELSTSAGAYDRTLNGGRDVYVVKLDTNGQPVWNTFLGGGDNDDRATALAVDASGKVYVAGSTTSADFPTTPAAYDRASNAVPGLLGLPGNQDGFVACFSADLTTLLWCTFLGGTSNDVIYGLALDSLGRPCVAGETSSSNFPTTAGAYDTTPLNDDAFVARLSSDGQSLLMSTVLGGGNTDGARAIAIGPGGEIYVCGKAGMNFPTTAGAFDTTFSNDIYDAFVSCLTASGNGLLWSTYLGSNGEDEARALAVDAAGVVTVGGYTQGTNFPTTAGAYDGSFNSNSDVFLTRLNAGGGSLAWSTYLGSTGFDQLRGMLVDASGIVTVSGTAGDPDTWPTTPGAFESLGGPVFLSAISSDGSTLAWSTLLGDGPGGPHALDGAGQGYVGGGLNSAFLTRVLANGAQVPWGMGLAGGGLITVTGLIRQPSGVLVLSGHTDRSTFPATPGAYDTSYNGYFDVVVARLTPPSVTPVVNDGLGADQVFHASGTSLPANWSGFEPGAVSYSLGLGRFRGTCDFNAFAPMGSASSGMATFPNVASGNRYFAIVRAEYASGLGLLGTSNGVILDHDGPLSPPAPVASPSLTQNPFTLTWSSSTTDPGGSGFDSYEVQYRLNAGPLTPLAAGLTAITLPVSGLADGSYRLSVRGVDVLGNLGNFSPASNVVIVDSTPPQTTILAGPEGPWGSTSATFTFSTSEPAGSFEVRLDGGVWEANGTATTKSYPALAAGLHTVDVRSTDAAGNTDLTPAIRTWTIGALVVDGTAPVHNSFDSPLALSNWTIVASSAAAWAVDGSPASVPGGAALSPPFSLNYNDGTDYDTGAANSGSATSPAIAIGGLAAPRLRFHCNYQTETAGTSKDLRRVRVSSDDFATDRLIEQLSTVPGAALLGPCAASGIWHEHVAALNPAWGSVKVRFEFDSGDPLSNMFAGWFIDDFDVTESLVSTMEQVDPLTSAVIPIGGACTGRTIQFRSRVSASAVGGVRWEFEVQPVGTAFTGTPSGSVEGSGAGSVLTSSLPMPSGTQFRWRARTVDLVGGATSGWVPFGINADTDVDYSVPAIPGGGGGGGGGGCGATSFEFLGPLALFWLWRRRRGPAAA